MSNSPRFWSIAYSGGLIPSYTATPRLPHPYVIDLTGTTATPKPSVNLDHKPERRIGEIHFAEVTATAILVEGRLSATTPWRDEVIESARTGMPWEVSIEGDLTERAFIAEGETTEVNGQKFKGPLFVFERCVFTALAFCSVGADHGNAVEVEQ